MLLWIGLFFLIFIIWFFWGGQDIPFQGLASVPNSEPPVQEAISEPVPELQLTPKLVAEPVRPIQKSVIRSSKGETICRQTLEEIYGKPFIQVRPSFLKNPETGRNLEYDCYNEELKIALEYNGEQHYVYPHPLHKSYQDFINTVRRDRYKAEMSEKLGIYLIVVPYTVSHDLIPAYIRHYLPENVGNF